MCCSVCCAWQRCVMQTNYLFSLFLIFTMLLFTCNFNEEFNIVSLSNSVTYKYYINLYKPHGLLQ